MGMGGYHPSPKSVATVAFPSTTLTRPTLVAAVLLPERRPPVPGPRTCALSLSAVGLAWFLKGARHSLAPSDRKTSPARIRRCLSSLDLFGGCSPSPVQNIKPRNTVSMQCLAYCTSTHWPSLIIPPTECSRADMREHALPLSWEAAVHGALFRLLSIYCVPGSTESRTKKDSSRVLALRAEGRLGNPRQIQNSIQLETGFRNVWRWRRGS